MKAAFLVLAMVLSMVATNASAEAVAGRIEDLAWMAGYWTGPFGEEILEEHWMPPSKDSVIGTVRLSKDGSTRMMEMLVIEPAGDSLVLRVNQWLPGVKSLHDEPQVLTLTDIGERRIAFESAGGFVFKSLAYSRPAEDHFVINAEFATGERLTLDLVPR